MSDNKSILGIVLAGSIGLLVTCGRLVKSCGKTAKGIHVVEGIEDFSHIKLNTINKGVRSSKVAEGLSNVNHINTIADKFILPDENSTKKEASIALNTSKLNMYLTNSPGDLFYVDSIHCFKDFKVYVPNIYRIHEYTNKKEVLQFTYGIERIRIAKTRRLTTNRSGEWLTNKKGVHYKLRNSSYVDEVLEYSYYFKTRNRLYQIYYIRDVSKKADIPKYIHRLEAFIQLIESD